ncbi:hypothetical protein TrLO_g5625 [Triparma laevis f. longispina]|uniref:Uncharacterized protein n=1 Tax=Triparma laevis f. longispina TaxID=1714387 RepID=A0A9W7CHI5_9STRA|nr:hypothetical protein TrLO_g5625 [Triparma laevis f. longispina]
MICGGEDFDFSSEEEGDSNDEDIELSRFDARTGKVITIPSKSSLSYQKSLSSSTTRSFRKGISRTATSIDDVRVEIHKIFPIIALVGQAIIALGCFMAFLVYWLHKKNVDDGLDVESTNGHTYTMINFQTYTMLYLISFNMHYFSIALFLLVAFHSPRTNWAAMETLSAILLLLDRIIFLTGNIAKEYQGEGVGWLKFGGRAFDGLTLLGVIFLVYRKRKDAAGLPTKNLREIVHLSLPRVTGSTIISLMFLTAEATGCLTRYPGEYLRCEDKVYSSSTFSLVFICISFIYLCVLPFHHSVYTISHFVKYDFHFREQVQMFLFLIGSAFALIVYASAQQILVLDDWFDSGRFTMASEYTRQALYGITQLFLVLLMTSVLSQDHQQEETLNSWTGWVRSLLMTRSDTEASPALRLALLASTILLCIPTVFFFWMSIFAAGDYSLESKTKFYYVANVCNPVIMTANVVLFMSRPRGTNKVFEKTAYVFCVVNSLLVSTASKVNGLPFGGTAFLVFFFTVCYRYFMKIRKFLKSHSDQQIHTHIDETFSLFVSAFGPSLYLISETLGCVSILPTDRCELMFNCNIVVIQHLMTGVMFFSMMNFTFAHQTWMDLVTFRNCDFPTFLRVTFVAFLSFIAFFSFGIRPKDSTGLVVNLYGYENESRVLATVSAFKYIMGFSWCALIFSFYYPIHSALMMERTQLETGLAVVDQHSSRRVRAWHRMEERLNHFMKRVTVVVTDIDVSPIYKVGTTAIVTVPFLCVAIWMIMLEVDPGNIMASYIYFTSTILLPMALFFAIVLVYSNLGELLGARIKLVSLAPSLTQLLILIMCLMHNDVIMKSAVYTLSFGAIMVYLWKEHERFVNKESDKKRRTHLYSAVTIIASSTLPPLIFISSEYIACVTRAYAIARDGPTLNYLNETLPPPVFLSIGPDAGSICDRLAYDLFPIMVCLVAGAVQNIIHPQAMQHLNMKNLVNLTLPKDMMHQFVLSCNLGMYSILKYGMRGEGQSTDSQKMQLVAFVLMSAFTAILPSIYRKLGKRGKKKDKGIVDFFDIEMEHEDDTHDHRVYMDDDFASKNADKRGSTVKFSLGATHRNEHETKIRRQETSGDGKKKKTEQKRYSELHYERSQVGAKKTLWEGGTKGLARLPVHDDFGTGDGKKEGDEVEMGAVNPGLL